MMILSRWDREEKIRRRGAVAKQQATLRSDSCTKDRISYLSHVPEFCILISTSKTIARLFTTI